MWKLIFVYFDMSGVGTFEDDDGSDLSFLFASPLPLSGGASELRNFLTYYNKILGAGYVGTSGFHMLGGAFAFSDFLAYHNQILHEASRRTRGLWMPGGASALSASYTYDKKILSEAYMRPNGLCMPGGSCTLSDFLGHHNEILHEASRRTHGLCMPGASSTFCDFFTNGNEMPKEVRMSPYDDMMFERKVPPYTSTARQEEVAVGRPLVTRMISPTKKVMGNAATAVARRALATQKRGPQKMKKAEKARQKNSKQGASHASAHVNDDDPGYFESGGLRMLESPALDAGWPVGNMDGAWCDGF